MRPLMMRRLREDDGFSLVTALLITLVIFILASVSFALSNQNLKHSGRNRERVNAVAAAEAGLNYQFSRLQAGTFEFAATQQLGSFPLSDFTTTLYGADGVTPLTAPPTLVNGKAKVLIRSVGRANSGPDPVRAMEALVEIERLVGGTLGEGAIFGEGDILIDSNPDIGNPAGDFNADVYSNGNIELKSNPKIVGNVIAQKCIKMDSTAKVWRDVWAKGGTGCAWSSTVTMLSNTQVLNDVIATTGSVEFSSLAKVSRDAKAGGTMTPWPATCPSPCHVQQNAVRNQAGLPTPVVRTFPAWTFNPADWTTDPDGAGPEVGYEVVNLTQSGDLACNAAKSLIGSNNTVKRVIRVSPSTCTLSWTLPSSSPITLSEDLAIVTDGSVFIDSGTRFIATTPQTLHFFVGQASTYQPDYCFEMKSTTRIENPISTLVYAPKKTDGSKCKVFLDSNADIGAGQIFGGNEIDLKSNTDMAYKPVIAPGAPATGFKESIIYIREIRPS